MTQDAAKEMRAAPLALHEDPGSLAEVDLQLLTRGTPHPAERDLGLMPEAADEAFDRVTGSGEGVFDHQILIDPLGGNPGPKSPPDGLPHRGAMAGFGA